LDEIERLVPGYRVARIHLLMGNDVGTELGFVPVSELTGPDLVVPAHDGLFTSGTLSRYSPRAHGTEKASGALRRVEGVVRV